MNGRLGLTYDIDTAVHFIHEHTGVAADIAAVLLGAKHRYLVGMGIAGTDDAQAEQEAQAIRASAPELFPRENMLERYVDLGLERAFIMMESGASEETVRAVVRADDEYMRTQGLTIQVG